MKRTLLACLTAVGVVATFFFLPPTPSVKGACPVAC